MRRSVEDPDNEENAFQDAFRQQLHGYRAPVDPQGWSRLEETLNSDSRNKRREFVTWLAAACITLLLVAGGTFTFLKFKENNPEVALKTVSDSVPKVANTKQEANETGTTKPATTNAQKQPAAPQEIAFIKPEKKTANAKLRNIVVAKSAKSAAIAQESQIAKGFIKARNSNAENGSHIVALEQPESYYTPKPATQTNSGIVNAPAEFSAPGAASYSSGKAAADNTDEMPSQTSEAEAAQPEPGQNATISYEKSSAAKSLVLTETPKRKQNAAKAIVSQLARARVKSAAPKSISETNGASEDISAAPGSETEKLTAAPVMASTINQVPDTAKEVLPKQNTSLVQAETATKPEEIEPAENSHSKWQVGVAYSGLNFQQNLEVNGFGEMSGDFSPQTVNGKQNYRFEAEREFNETTRSAYSWQTSVSVGYNLNPHLTVLSGLQFSACNAQTLTHYFLREIPAYPMMNVPNPQAIENELSVLQSVLQNPTFPDSVIEIVRAGKQVNYNYQYIGLPLSLEYHTAFKSKWNIFVKSGLAINRLIKTSFSAGQPNAKYEARFKTADDPFRSWQATVNSAAGISYKLDSNWQLKAGMESTVFLQSLAKQNQYLHSGLPYSYGLSTSLAYQF